jgi:hypothetical protein
MTCACEFLDASMSKAPAGRPADRDNCVAYLGPIGRRHDQQARSISSSFPIKAPMSQIHQFKEPLKLKDGRQLEMLSDVQAFILALPQQRQAEDHWQYAAHLLTKARRPMATEFVIDLLAKQLALALETERLV